MNEPLTTSIERPVTRVDAAEEAADNMREACALLTELHRGLLATEALFEERVKTHFPDPDLALASIFAHVRSLESRIATEQLIYPGLMAGDDSARPGLLPLRHWQFLAEQAVRITEAAERAFALDLTEASAQLFVHALDVLSRITLEVERELPAPAGRPSARSNIRH